MLDTATLRVSFSLIALTLLLLFYFVTYRRTRSSYSGWWALSLLLFLGGASSYLLDGTEQQVWANPLGNALGVAGSTATWMAARSLRAKLPVFWHLAAAPLLTGIVSALDNPAVNTWSGGTLYLTMMGLLLALSSRELFQVDRDYSKVHRPLAAISAALSIYYLLRAVVFTIDGQDGALFLTVFGSATTTLITGVLMVGASFSMTELSNEQQTQDLRARATMDGLTGLLNRTAFLDLAGEELRRLGRARTSSALVLADLDHFKSVNDQYGHAAGDTALQAFANACSTTVRSTDLVARYGGEEFIMLLPGVTSERAAEIAAEISRRLQATESAAIPHLPTVSYGISSTGPGRVDLPAMVAAADSALYEAKRQGRDRSVLAGGPREDRTA